MDRPDHTPCVLIVRDGWGENPNPDHDAFNAVRLAQTPVDDALAATWPRTLIGTSGEDVGLLDGTMGNSEVGHQNIGAGRVVAQDAVRITHACRTGTLRENEILTSAMRRAEEAGRAVHLLSICSDAGVHGLIEHLDGLLRLARDLGCARVFVHLFTDGRDTGPFTGAGYAEQVEAMCAASGARIATVVGRYWAMDRDHRWERVARAFRALTGRPETEPGPRFDTADEAIRAYYDAPDGPAPGDEFVTPRYVGASEDDVHAGRIGDGDTVIFANYRGDRPREICAALIDPAFPENAKPSPDSGMRGFERGAALDLDFVIMTPYSQHLASLAEVAFPKPPKMEDILGGHLSRLGLRQFRCAETEKFPHVTFFFNDYRDEPFAGEDRAIVQSPKVATYDLQPEMSARGVCDAVLGRLAAEDCEPVIIVNFANPDMVGHTGSLEAAVRACEVVDGCVGEIVDATLARGGSLVVTADHGNAEQMHDPATGAAHTAHTTYPVPLYVIGEHVRGARLRDDGVLGDIAPTMLGMLGMEPPPAMTGRSLILR